MLARGVDSPRLDLRTQGHPPRYSSNQTQCLVNDNLWCVLNRLRLVVSVSAQKFGVTILAPESYESSLHCNHCDDTDTKIASPATPAVGTGYKIRGAPFFFGGFSLEERSLPHPETVFFRKKKKEVQPDELL